MIFVTPPAAEKRQNFFGVFLLFQIGVDTQKIEETIIKALELYRKRQREVER